MRGKVEVMEPAAFDDWLAGQASYAQIAARAPADPTKGKTLFAVCTSCHGAEGQGNATLNAPALAGQPSWYLERQLQNFKAGVRGAHPEDTHGQQMRAMVATLTDPVAVADVAAYVQTLSPVPNERTLYGDPHRGAQLYRYCGNCHGANGEGIQARNGPRLAGMNDWYLLRQLENFRQGLRGRHADDLYGWQMAEMARVLPDERAVRDVVAYVSELRGAPKKMSVAERAEEN
jgi:cytochrome c oxidase subunit 2